MTLYDLPEHVAQLIRNELLISARTYEVQGEAYTQIPTGYPTWFVQHAQKLRQAAQALSTDEVARLLGQEQQLLDQERAEWQRRYGNLGQEALARAEDATRLENPVSDAPSAPETPQEAP